MPIAHRKPIGNTGLQQSGWEKGRVNEIAQPGALQGQNLRSTLRQAGITKWRLSKDCGISYRTIQYWEKGTSVPSQKYADKVFAYLGLAIPTDDSHADILKRLSAIEAQLGISEGRKT